MAHPQGHDAMHEIGDIRRQFRRFANLECRGYSTLYEGLALAVAGDDDLLAFIARMPVTQPNLFFADIQRLTGTEGMPRTRGELRDLFRRRGGEIGAVMRSRRTQTNEVGRCAVLLPALPPGPLALVEVGASAGLCLLLDRFFYDFGGVTLGDAGSPVRLQCELAGPTPLPASVPVIGWRAGLDVHPIDVRDADAVAWLLACVWADHHGRRRRLQAAIELARADPPALKAGDLVDDLPGLLDAVPRDLQLVVVHSAVLSYVSPQRRRAFADELASASMRRDVLWLSNEAPGVVPEMAGLAPAPGPLRFRLGRTRFAKGRRSDELLALAHPHGAKLAWAAPAGADHPQS